MEETKEYDVVFMMDDGKTVVHQQKAAKGTECVYSGPTPTKPDTLDGRFVFIGWSNEEELKNIQSDLVCIAKFNLETKSKEDIAVDLTEGVALEAELDNVLEAGKKISEQQKALELDPRTTEEIISDIKENGRTEIGSPEQEMDR
jgi:hypothetical protein